MPTCSFCKKQYKEPRGLTLFTFDGKTIHFCSSKCQRNFNLKRDPKKVNWIKRNRKETEVSLTSQPSLSKSEEKKEEKKEKASSESKVEQPKEEKVVEKKEEKKVEEKK